MVAANYSPALARILVHEGGYANHPKDPGGATMKGVTQRVYDAFRERSGLPKVSVRLISTAELETIYADQYGRAVCFDQLPIGLDYVVFDGAVHSGPAQSVKWLQRALQSLGLYVGKIDGIPGNGTLAAVDRVNDVDALIARICDLRLAFLKALKTYATFGKGWRVRVDQVGDAGQDWADGSVPRAAASRWSCTRPSRIRSRGWPVGSEACRSASWRMAPTRWPITRSTWTASRAWVARPARTA
ncbi:glycoside hydrolase family 108 protein [Aureimonas ureilytica]|uniref:glycoside hydrolase family 108 protein n=1 Tax=Aureimonas ureilytica TaxID=401562 RepID=UPI000733DEE5|nr:glycosyl hydrolase 108 family protein [Aureimonas ureilytica]